MKDCHVVENIVAQPVRVAFGVTEQYGRQCGANFYSISVSKFLNSGCMEVVTLGYEAMHILAEHSILLKYFRLLTPER